MQLWGIMITEAISYILEGFEEEGDYIFLYFSFFLWTYFC